MRITLRHIAGVIVAVAVVLALVVSQRRNDALERRNHELRLLCGHIGQHDDDRLLVTTLGPTMGQFGTRPASHLIRVDSHDEYRLDITAYDGIKQKTRSTSVPFSEPMLAITMVPHDGHVAFLVQSTFYGAETVGRLECATGERELTHYRPIWSIVDVTEELALVYWFVSQNTELRTQEGMLDVETPEELRQNCRELGALVVFFRIRRR